MTGLMVLGFSWLRLARLSSALAGCRESGEPGTPGSIQWWRRCWPTGRLAAVGRQKYEICHKRFFNLFLSYSL